MEFYFWKAPSGKIPVIEFIDELDNENKTKLFKRLEFFKELPVSSMWKEQNLRKYDSELNYLRIILKGVYCRIFCTVEGQKCVLFHAFIKKGRKIPPREAKIAKERVRIPKAKQN